MENPTYEINEVVRIHTAFGTITAAILRFDANDANDGIDGIEYNDSRDGLRHWADLDDIEKLGQRARSRFFYS